MEQFYSYIPYGIRSTVGDKYLHRILCSYKKNRSGSTPYVNKRNRKRKNKRKKRN